MDNLNNIPNVGNWGDVSSRINDNFSKVNNSITRLDNIEQNRKGYFVDDAELKAAYPSPNVGWYAYVGSTNSIWGVNRGNWRDTQEPIPSDVDLSGYAHITDLALKANHGYTSNPKTLKQVDDEVIQLADIYSAVQLYQGTPYNPTHLNVLCSAVLPVADYDNIQFGLSNYVDYKYRFIGSDTSEVAGTIPATPYYQVDKVLDDALVLAKPYVWMQILRVDGGNLTPSSVVCSKRLSFKEEFIKLRDALSPIPSAVNSIREEMPVGTLYKNPKILYQGSAPYHYSPLVLHTGVMKQSDFPNIRVGLSDYSDFKFRFVGSDTEVVSEAATVSPFYEQDTTLVTAGILAKPYVWVQVMRLVAGNISTEDVQCFQILNVKDGLHSISRDMEVTKRVAEQTEKALGDYINLIPDNVFIGQSIEYWENQPSYAKSNVLLEREIFKNPFSQYSLKVTGNYEAPLKPSNVFMGIYQDITSIVSEGDILVFKGLIYPTEPSCYLDLRLRDSSNATIYDGSDIGLIANQWNEINIEVEVPANVVYANIYARYIPNGTDVYFAAWDIHKKIKSKLYPKINLPTSQEEADSSAKIIYVNAITGNDSFIGSSVSPVKTILRAITLLSFGKNGKIVVDGGDYRETLDLSSLKDGDIEIVGKVNQTVRILGSSLIDGWALTAGKVNVYEAAFMGEINATKPVIFEDGRPSQPILDEERHALQKSNTHRLPYTKITAIPFNTDLATTLNDLENSAGKYYHDVANDTLYIHTTDSNNPETNGYSYEYAMRGCISSPSVGSTSRLKLTNLSFYFSNTYGINLTGFGEVERQWVTVMGSVNNGIQDSSTYVISHNDEVADTRDGLAGTHTITGNNRERNNVTYIGAWSHDNSDDGTSHHSKANVKTIGCLFEYNGKSGIAPSNTCQWTDINSICRKNGGAEYPSYGEGVEVINSILTGDNGIGCTFTGFGTICEGNRIGFGARNSDTVRVHLYGCVSRNNTDAEYYADAGKMYANNCKATNADPLKLKVVSGTGEINVTNDDQLN